MPRILVRFQDEELTLEVPEDRLIAAWLGPGDSSDRDDARRLAKALEEPRDFPPLRQAVVPGDRVVIPVGPGVPNITSFIQVVYEVLRESGVEAGDLTILAANGRDDWLHAELPAGVVFRTHDPDDQAQIAYLATTAEGRRIYLNRLLTDADFVLPIGGLVHDPIRGSLGPWSAVFPAMSDAETLREFHASAGRAGPDAVPGLDVESPTLREASEVCWLLGCQFQIGVVPAVSGVWDVVAGLGTSVMRDGIEALEKAWGSRVESRAELVILGIGRPGTPTTIEDLARGLATARRLARRGGKIVILSRTRGDFGPAMNASRGLESPREMLAALRGLEDSPDYLVARQFAASLAWADLYLHSDLDRDVVEEFSIVPLDRPEEAARLAALSGSCIVVSQGDRTHASVTGEANS
ncbi:MAG: lactate racemase domain-containing protein [Isosphaeraceae bacterium]